MLAHPVTVPGRHHRDRHCGVDAVEPEVDQIEGEREPVSGIRGSFSNPMTKARLESSENGSQSKTSI